MRTLNRKLFLPIILSVLFLFFPSDQYAAETHENATTFPYSGKYFNSDSIPDAPVSLIGSESQGNLYAINTAVPPRILSRLDIYEIIFGTLLSFVGLALIVLSFLRWKANEKRLGILVADVSGHGVPASLISSMVKIAFASITSYVSNPAKVLDGINQVLFGKLESDFVTAR